MTGAPEGVGARRTALEVLSRVIDQGAYANIALPAVLARSELDERDRALATDLVYGTVRMRRACEFLVDRFLTRRPPPAGRAALLLGAYQVAYRNDIPAYAAVSSTVGATPKRFRSLVNAVLRKVAGAPLEFPDAATELSYPDWLVELMVADHGKEAALAALAAMNEPAATHVRADGYVQDLASQWVAEHFASALDPTVGSRVVELCAAPGGKATAVASKGSWVAALDLRDSRVELLRSNIAALGTSEVAAVRGDALRVPFAAGSVDGVLLDAPCSGLGVLRRRPDARWRLEEAAPGRLAALQRSMVDAAVGLVRDGGVLTYSVCTLSANETLGIDEHLATTHPHMQPLEPPGAPWIPWGRGALLMPDARGSDGMALFSYRAGGGAGGPVG